MTATTPTVFCFSQRRCRGSWLAAILAVTLFLAAAPGPLGVQAFKPNEQYGHGFITRAAVQASGLPFCPEAADNLVDNDLNVDFGREFFVPPAHCDDEHINECTTRIATFRDMAVQQFKLGANQSEDLATRAGAVFMGWSLVGRALHTLQDFYAHSNWINMGQNTIHPDVGQRSIAHNPTPQDVICKPDHATHVGTVLSTGYFPIGLFQDLCDDEVPKGKCRHGMQIPGYDCPEGLNKDDPSRPFFTQAQQLAIQASTRYLTDIHTMLATAELQELFLGACGISMYYIVDISPSMQEEIAGILSFIRNQTQAADAAQVARFGLTTFGTSDKPTTRSYATANAFLAALNNVKISSSTPGGSPSGNASSNCADYLFTALLEASQDAPRRSELRVFADAGARDADIAGLAAANALSKQQTVRFFLTGTCAKGVNSTNSTAGIDDSIAAFSDNTGATVIATDKTEVFNSLNLVTTRLAPGAAVIFAAQMPTSANSTVNLTLPPPTITTVNVTNGNTTTPVVKCVSPALCFCANVNFTAPSWGSNYVFAATYRDVPGLRSTAFLYGPSGAVTLNNTNFTGATQSTTGVLASGIYTYRFCTNINNLTVTLTGVGHGFPFYAEDFSFSQLLGRPGQAALRPTLSAPIRRDNRNFGVRIFLENASVLNNNALTNTTVWFLSANNTVVLGRAVTSYFATGDTQHALIFTNNSVDVPVDRFYVVMTGLYQGTPFQLALDTPVVPQALQVDLEPRRDDFLEKLVGLVNEIAGVGNPAPFTTLPLNSTSTVSFKISNKGDKDLRVGFSVNEQTVLNGSAFDDFNITLPAPVSIDAGDDKTVDFKVTPRRGLPHNSSYVLVFAAHSTDNPLEANFLQTEIQFVGCQSCPQEIGVCEVVNGTYQCNCYLGVTEGSCDNVENKLERAAKLLAVAAIVGIVVAAAVCCGLLALIIYCCCFRRRPTKTAADSVV